jgi:hypothetical protein
MQFQKLPWKNTKMNQFGYDEETLPTISDCEKNNHNVRKVGRCYGWYSLYMRRNIIDSFDEWKVCCTCNTKNLLIDPVNRLPKYYPKSGEYM